MFVQTQEIIDIAKKAGEIHLRYFGSDLDVQYKIDQFDPVTTADKESDEYIRAAIGRLFPNDEILSEENDDQPKGYDGRVWMIDPLDGTKDFIAGRSCFSIIIGLLEKNEPTFGLVYAPAQDELFYAQKGEGAFSVIGGVVSRLIVSDQTDLSRATLITRNVVDGDVRPLDPQLDKLKVARRMPEGSIGLKIARIAAGIGDVFVNTTTKACKWDTLGSHVILTEAGGVIADLEGGPLDYSKPTVNWDKYFVAANNQTLLDRTLTEFKLPESNEDAH